MHEPIRPSSPLNAISENMPSSYWTEVQFQLDEPFSFASFQIFERPASFCIPFINENRGCENWRDYLWIVSQHATGISIHEPCTKEGSHPNAFIHIQVECRRLLVKFSFRNERLRSGMNENGLSILPMDPWTTTAGGIRTLPTKLRSVIELRDYKEIIVIAPEAFPSFTNIVSLTSRKHVALLNLWHLIDLERLRWISMDRITHYRRTHARRNWNTPFESPVWPISQPRLGLVETKEQKYIVVSGSWSVLSPESDSDPLHSLSCREIE